MALREQPMVMGSPATSPGSPGSHNTSSFLPSYLMGDPAPAVQSPNSRLWSATGNSPSSSRLMINRSALTSPHAADSQSPVTNLPVKKLFSHTGHTDPRARDMHPKEKCGAPPIQGLMESFLSPASTPDRRVDDVSAAASFYGTPTAPYTLGPGVTSTPSMVTPSRHDQSAMFDRTRKTPPSPAQLDPFYTQGENLKPDDILDDTWVTIFGFPLAATSYILQQFSQYGSILKHTISPDGNWMHLHYQSKFQAKKALSQHGKIFGNSIMVGVTPCIDKKIMECGRDGNASHTELRTSYLGTPNNHGNDPNCSRQGGTPIRPLTAAYKAACHEHEVVHKSNLPQKETGMVSKAMDYIFGW